MDMGWKQALYMFALVSAWLVLIAWMVAAVVTAAKAVM